MSSHYETPVSIAKFRDDLKEHYEAAVKGGVPVPVRRAHDPDIGIMLNAETLIPAPGSFHPSIHADGSQIAVWLPEFDLYGMGDTTAEAQADLLDEVREYIVEYFEEGYSKVPNRRHHGPDVLRAYAADLLGRLESVIFGEAAVPTEA